MLNIKKSLLLLTSLFISSLAIADITVPMTVANGPDAGKAAGSITISSSKYGLMFTPDLHGLPQGIHGLHIHENPSCEQNAAAAGGHWDPKKTGKHLGPYNDKGHMGDLPVLYIGSDGSDTLPVLAPRLKSLAALKNHSLMIHEGGDDYADQPKLGGGGMRMVCGVIK